MQHLKIPSQKTPNHKAQIKWTIYGSELSPFTLKVLAMCQYMQLNHQLYPAQASFFGAMRTQLRKTLLTKGMLPLSFPVKTDDDEYPLVPFMFNSLGENFYDSSAFAIWLNNKAYTGSTAPLLPKVPALYFLTQLIDEYADEFSLYMVHHNRWKLAAKTNDAGMRLAHEIPTPACFKKPIAGFFSRRQVRRLPYLFSVAPTGYHIAGLANALQPPAKTGFPATHTLLETAFANLLAALETVLANHAFLFGNAPTLADFSLYGQLAMNLTDPNAKQQIQTTAPHTFAWLEKFYTQKVVYEAKPCKLAATSHIRPLLAEICRTFVPLMQQNYAAYQQIKAEKKAQQKPQSSTVFNEKAFNENISLGLDNFITI